MKLGNSISTATFVSRPNRFLILAKHGNGLVKCHFPNPGRMEELLRPGAIVALNESASPTRKTEFDTVAVFTGKLWVSIDSRIPNQLVKQALEARELLEFKLYSQVKPESPFRHSRFDFLLKSKSANCLLEVKSCTLVVNKVAIFPDAPTDRGRKHLLDLIKAKKSGYRAYVLFVIQRSDAVAFAPNAKTDLKFAEALKLAEDEGVEVYARRCRVRNFQIHLGERVPVLI